GNDTLRHWSYPNVDTFDHLDGGADNDTADFSGFGRAVWVGLDYAGAEARTTKTYDATGAGPWWEIAHLDNIENIVGTAWRDMLIGDAGNNRIDGGFGNDVLTGNAGMDAFVFRSFLFDGSLVDQITDFSVADDTIHLDNFAFDGLFTEGVLAAGAFRV